MHDKHTFQEWSGVHKPERLPPANTDSDNRSDIENLLERLYPETVPTSQKQKDIPQKASPIVR